MTNKPMLSVDLRALLERLLSHDFAEECQECGIGYSDAWEELRALLDKPVLESQYEGMTQDQAQAVSDGVDEILHGEPAAHKQPAPVAVDAEILERFPEINFANYGQDEVEALQAWAFEAYEAIARLNGVKP